MARESFFGDSQGASTPPLHALHGAAGAMSAAGGAAHDGVSPAWPPRLDSGLGITNNTNNNTSMGGATQGRQLARSTTSQRVRTAVSSFLESMHTMPLALLTSGAEAVNERYLKPAMQRVGPQLTRVLSAVVSRDAAGGATAGDAGGGTGTLSRRQSSLAAAAEAAVAAIDAEAAVASGGGRGNAANSARKWLRREMVGPGKAPLLLSVTVAAAGVGVSCVTDVEEVAYLQLGAVQVGLSVSSVQVRWYTHTHTHTHTAMHFRSTLYV